MGTTRRYFRYLLRGGRTRNALVMAIHDQRLAAAAEQLPRGSPARLIDIGCGTKPYRQMFAPFVGEYVGLDLADTRYDPASVDLIGTATAVPAADGAFDVLLSTSNLEHVEEPAAALREWARILRPGGTAIVTVPMHWHLHDEPRDFYRFTPHGLEHLFTQAGFTLDRLETLGGFWTAAATMTSYYLFKFNRGPLRWLGVIHAVSALIQTAGLMLEKLDPAKRWACMLLVVAHRNGKETNG